jgi:hypothetical protein
MADRIGWIKHKVCKNLAVQEAEFDQLLEQEGNTGKGNYTALNEFFDAENELASAVIFYTHETLEEPVPGACPYFLIHHLFPQSCASSCLIS